MKKVLLLLVVTIITTFTFAQTTILSNDFEGAGDDGWTMVNSATNQWRVGAVGTPSGGTKHAFITNDAGVTNSYTNSSSTVSHLYRSVTFPAGEGAIILSFDVRGTGEPGASTTSYDYLRVSLTAAAPVAGTLPAVSDQLTAYFSGYSTHKKVYIAVPASFAGTTKNLVFSFNCDASGGDVSAGFAVDNVSLISNAVTPLSGTKTLQTGGDFTTFGELIANINAHGVAAGGLTCNVAAGQTFNEAPTGLSPLAGNGSIIIQKSGAGANPKLINQGTSSSRVTSTGSVTKSGTTAVFALYGNDNVTIDGIDFETAEFIVGSNCVNTGVGIFNVSATDGATNNILRNLSIKTNTTMTSSVGIYQNVFVAPTNASGANSNNTYKNLTISNSYRSIFLVGNTTYRDDNNLITADPAYNTGINTVGYNDLGNITVSATSGIRAIEIQGQNNINIEKSEIRNVSSTNTGSTNDVAGILVMSTASNNNLTIQNNLIHDIAGVGTGTQVVYGIWFSGACAIGTSNVKGNKVYKISGQSTTTGTTRGILYSNSSSTATGNIINNMVYQLESPKGNQSSAGATSIRGIELNGAYAVNLYHNTVYLDAAYTGTSTNHFQTACLYMASSASTILDMKNNIFVNNSSTSTTGTQTRAVAFYKTTSTIGTQISTASNNNLLYAGGASSKNLLYYASTGSGAQNLGTYITNSADGINNGGGSRENAAVTENPPFLSASGTYDLHISTVLPTFTESKGTPIGSVTTDIDGDARNATTPDIGADEFAGIAVSPCVTPSAQPTALNVNATGTTTISGSFTAASPAPSNYLIVRTTSNTLAATPVDATSYSVGANAYFGTGGYVESVGNTTSFSSTGLSAGTTYYYWIFSFNNNSCTGGPTYLTSSPLSGNATTALVFTSVTSGNWEDASTWDQGINIPTSLSVVTIAATHTVTVNATPSVASNVTVNSTGVLNITGSSLTIATTLTNNGAITVSAGTLNVTGASASGITNAVTTGTFTVSGGTVNLGPSDNSFCNRTFTNNGTLSVSSGNLNVYGNLNSANGSTFNQSGGIIKIDGNAGGSVANSVGSGIAILAINTSSLNLTGGTILLVDPNTNSTGLTFDYNNATAFNPTQTSTHIIQFGDGISSDATSNTSGFTHNTWTSSGRFQYANLTLDAGTTGNRALLTPSYSHGIIRNLNINSGVYAISTTNTVIGGNLTVNSSGTLQANATVTFGTFNSGTIAASSISQTISGSGTFRNALSAPTANFVGITVNNSNPSGVTFTSGLTPTISGAITVTTGSLNADAITLQGSTAQTVTLTAATSLINLQNFTLNNSAGATLSGSGFVNVYDTYTPTVGALTAGGRLVLKSTNTKTGRIAAGIGSYISGNIIQERFIPAKTARGWSFVSSPVSQALSATWQQQIHITGAGSGGTVCPTLTAHSNGFDATVTNAPSMYSYDASQPTNSRWIANTTGTTAFTLTPGDGYRLNIRGPRSTGCSLLDGTVLTTSDVTLSATGAMTSGTNFGAINKTYTGVGPTNWVLIGNPYPSQISFSALQAANSANIANSYAIYRPQNPAGNYGYWDGSSSFTGAGATGLDNASGNVIANGQAVFVQTTGSVAADLTLAFAEAHKTNSANNGYFRTTTYNEMLRIGYQVNGNKVDEIIVRYSNDKDVDNTSIGVNEAVSMNAGAQYLTSLKGTKGMAIQTRSLTALNNFAKDEIALNVVSTQSGTYQLNFSDYDKFTGYDIYLIDNYTNSRTNIKQQNSYEFSVDKNNAATQGKDRFVIEIGRSINPVFTQINSIKAYPNPANKQVTIELPQSNGNYTIKLTDVTGRTVVQQTAQAGVNTINLSKLGKGSYVVEITDAQGNRTTQKLVKQ